MSTATRIGKIERNFVIEAVKAVLGNDSRLSALGRDFFVGSPESCLYWTALVRAVLEAEAEAEEQIAKEARQLDARRGIQPWQTFKAANARKEKLARFDHALSEARAADETTRLAREAELAAKAAAAQAS